MTDYHKSERGSFRGIAALAISASLVLVPASQAQARKRKASGYEATLPVAAPSAGPANGSIFNVNHGYAALHEGRRARAVGDVLTVLLLESTTTAKTVGSKSQKNGGVSITPPASGPLSINPDALKASSKSSFNGNGNAAQNNTLSGSISVTIAQVRSNGTALVRGEKKMVLSQGQEWIQFSGIVRLRDIDMDNSIASTRVADAQISYSGKGALHRASKQGWLGKFFNMISPF
ncbi:MAG: flagellar basal body L-ring protein FlgH [Sphingomonadaceae bacterium]|nr:flagellar basal body L-ring protein FlgH [Sphingomonadaceae bacterium]